MRYESQTEGIRVSVQPEFSLARSDPEQGNFVFAYEIRLWNEGVDSAQLLFRHWRIHDAAGEDTVVDGEGVVGEQPVLTPGAFHRYSSFCILSSPIGFMEGRYTFGRPDGSRFDVPVPRFDLEAPLPPFDLDETSEQAH